MPVKTDTVSYTVSNSLFIGVGVHATGLHLYKNYAARPSDLGLLQARSPCLQPAPCLQPPQKPAFSFELSAKPTILASWRPSWPADGPPGAQDGLLTGLLAPRTASRRASWSARRLPTGLLAPQTTSGWASWRPRRPPDRPPGAQDGLQTGSLTPQTASDGPSPADKFICRQDHLPTRPPADKSALAPSEPSTPALFCRSRRTAVTACLTRQPSDELSCMSTFLHVNLLPSHYATGSH